MKPRAMAAPAIIETRSAIVPVADPGRHQLQPEGLVADGANMHKNGRFENVVSEFDRVSVERASNPGHVSRQWPFCPSVEDCGRPEQDNLIDSDGRRRTSGNPNSLVHCHTGQKHAVSGRRSQDFAELPSSCCCSRVAGSAGGARYPTWVLFGTADRSSPSFLRASEVRDQARRDRIENAEKDHGNRGACRHGCTCRRHGHRDDDVDPGLDQVPGKRREPLDITIRPARLDDQISVFDVPQPGKRLRDTGGCQNLRRRGCRRLPQDTDTEHTADSLGQCRSRHRQRPHCPMAPAKTQVRRSITG